jgi:hypothetical protein
MNLAILIFGLFEKSLRYSATPVVLARTQEAESELHVWQLIGNDAIHFTLTL